METCARHVVNMRFFISSQWKSIFCCVSKEKKRMKEWGGSGSSSAALVLLLLLLLPAVASCASCFVSMSCYFFDMCAGEWWGGVGESVSGCFLISLQKIKKVLEFKREERWWLGSSHLCFHSPKAFAVSDGFSDVWRGWGGIWKIFVSVSVMEKEWEIRENRDGCKKCYRVFSWCFVP